MFLCIYEHPDALCLPAMRESFIYCLRCYIYVRLFVLPTRRDDPCSRPVAITHSNGLRVTKSLKFGGEPDVGRHSGSFVVNALKATPLYFEKKQSYIIYIYI